METLILYIVLALLLIAFTLYVAACIQWSTSEPIGVCGLCGRTVHNDDNYCILNEYGVVAHKRCYD